METETALQTNARGPLPQGWIETTDAAGIRCYKNHDLDLRTYYDPRKPNPHGNGFVPTSVDGPPLPSNWEAVQKPGSSLVFLDHNTRSSTRNDPRGLNPLPEGWEQITDESGANCFKNDELNMRTYYDPRKPNPHGDGFVPTPVDGPPLPSRWEAVQKPGGPLVFLDHNTHSSTVKDPRAADATVATGDGIEV
ncbi:hypothetical protein MMC25_003830 [Agyrium rufum]|nr:hypothetical protein [Agyrium rufum]